MNESLENQIIQLLTDILAVRTLDEDLARRCMSVIMTLVTGENTTPTPAVKAVPVPVKPVKNNNSNPPPVRLAAYDQLISPVPDGDYIASLAEASSRINKDNIVTVKLSFQVNEGEHRGEYLIYVMTLNNIGLNKYWELLHSFCGDDGLDECYKFIQDNQDPATSFSRVLERFYGIPKKVSWRNKKGYKGFNALKILS